MAEAQVCGRLPSLELALLGGGSTDLADFYGQKLVVFFCASGEAKAEIASFEALSAEFEHAGAWLIGVAAGQSPPTSISPNIDLGIDGDGTAFKQLSSLAPAPFTPAPGEGATFVIDRCGRVREAWEGVGHAGDALRSVRERP